MDLPNYSLFDMMLIKSTPEKRRSMKKTKTNGKKRAEGCEFAKEPNVYDGRSEKQVEHDRMMKDFLDNGGKVEVIPSGISGADYYGVSNSNWKKRSRKSY
jgi:hypothetical protein|tara:strand:+ start:457 stop:756 length:300 start_codon:yes stop_codon:yes gene_type:complete